MPTALLEYLSGRLQTTVSPARHRGRAIAFALLVGLLFRLAIFATIDMPPSAHDEPEYKLLAVNMVEHQTYSTDHAPPFKPTYGRVPLQPLFLAACYAIFGNHWFVARLLQMVMTLAAALLVYAVLAKRKPRFAWVVLWAAMLCPAEAFIAGRLMPEPLTGFCMVLAICLPWLIEGRAKWIWTGAALGLLVLARDVYVLMIPLIALLLVVPFTKNQLHPHGWRQAALLLLAAAVVIAPWTYRNYRSSGQFIATSYGYKWLNIWVGTWEVPSHVFKGTPQATPDLPYRNAEERRIAEAAFQPGFHDKESAFKPLAMERLRSNPMQMLKSSISRYYLLWIGPRAPIAFKATALQSGHRGFFLVKGGLMVFNTAIVLLALVGLVISVIYRSWLLWFALPVVYNGVIFFPVHNAETRYTEPVFLFVLAFAIVPIWMAFRGRMLHSWVPFERSEEEGHNGAAIRAA